MPQTIEAINILRNYKTPFVIAANKIDRINGWDKNNPLNKQADHVRANFDDKFWKLIEGISKQGFDADLYNNFGSGDFAKKIAIVPISSAIGTGVPELLTILMGLAQQYLQKKLTIDYGTPAKGTILEVKEEKGLGPTIDVIIYDGHLKKGDKIVVGTKGEPIVAKVKAILRPKPLDEMRDPREKFSSVNEVYAACGIKIVAPGLENALSGAPLYVSGENTDAVIDAVKKEIGEIEVVSDRMGVIVKTDALGSLEAIVNILSKSEIPIRKGTVGKVSKSDVMEALAVRHENEYFGAILAFNTQVLKDAASVAQDNNVKIFERRIIYQLMDDYVEWRDKEKKKMFDESTTVTPAKMKIMPRFVFRKSDPAIVGVEILAGTIKTGCRLMKADGSVVGRIRGIQDKKEAMKSAAKGQQVSISLDDVVIGKHLDEGDIFYPFISIGDMESLIVDELTNDEKEALLEIRKIKRNA